MGDEQYASRFPSRETAAALAHRQDTADNGLPERGPKRGVRLNFETGKILPAEGKMELTSVRMEIPEDANLILGQSHFIKTAEDIYEAVVNTVPGAKFAVAFNEASGPCLVRVEANDEELRKAAIANALGIGAGHVFVLLLRQAYPINLLKRVQDCFEVCSIYCASANPVEVIVAQTAQGRGVLGMVDGSSPKGVEKEEDARHRYEFVRKIGYKL
jgi:uncharacterized protein